MGFPTKNDHFGVFGGTTIEGNTYVCAGISPPLKADSWRRPLHTYEQKPDILDSKRMVQ